MRRCLTKPCYKNSGHHTYDDHLHEFEFRANGFYSQHDMQGAEIRSNEIPQVSGFFKGRMLI